MFCINCGSENVIETTQPNRKVLVERGDYDERSGKYKEEFEATILECEDCNHEMINCSG